MVVLIVSASKRILGRRKAKNYPITREMLKPLVESTITESWKCDQFRDRAWIIIAGTNLEDYISAAQIILSEDSPLFRALATPWAKEIVGSQWISSTRSREFIKIVFRDVTGVFDL